MGFRAVSGLRGMVVCNVGVIWGFWVWGFGFWWAAGGFLGSGFAGLFGFNFWFGFCGVDLRRAGWFWWLFTLWLLRVWWFCLFR